MSREKVNNNKEKNVSTCNDTILVYNLKKKNFKIIKDGLKIKDDLCVIFLFLGFILYPFCGADEGGKGKHEKDIICMVIYYNTCLLILSTHKTPHPDTIFLGCFGSVVAGGGGNALHSIFINRMHQRF